MERDADDAVLVEAARRGDKEAFAALVLRHRPLLDALCRRALADAGLAEDAAQEAILHAWLDLDRLRRPERFGPWLAGIGLNLCHRCLRYRRREAWSWEAVLGGRLAPEPADAAPGPAELAERDELRGRVRRAVAGLPPGQRAAVTLHYLAGLTQAEAAAVLGIEVGAVKTRLHKARAALRTTLWDEWHPPRGGKGGPVMVEMRVGDVRRVRPAAELPEQPVRHVVLLEEVGGERRLPIWIGEFEATALALQLERVAHPRPLTYAFAANLLAAAGGAVREARIDRLAGDVFYAGLVVAGPSGERAVDARPSDALNLALLAGAPIRVAAGILASVADTPRREGEPGWEEATEGSAAIAAAVQAEWAKHDARPTAP